MKKAILTIMALCAGLFLSGQNPRSETLLTEWEFQGKKVNIPHDWAISGPFDRNNDLYEIAVIQNGETEASIKTGRTGGLPYVGKGSYRRNLNLAPADGKRYILLFDGAMSEAHVILNGREVCFWPYGYNSFHCDITDALHAGDNELVVNLENREQSSRWYPGAGLYRKVRLLEVPEVHVPVWGTYITTPYVSEDYAIINIKTTVEGAQDGEALTLRTTVKDSAGNVVACSHDVRKVNGTLPLEQNLKLENPALWSPENPALYYAETEIMRGGKAETEWGGRNRIVIEEGHELCDVVSTRFGVRSVEIRPYEGFLLNGEVRKFKGVCLHHDLGPLGAAINKSAIRRQLTILKDMGCDAIRTSHNMPAEELVELCEEMGFMMMVEPFDEWDMAKCENGYHRFFNRPSPDGRIWAVRDMENMLHHFRNSPAVVMWSIGNEVPSQWAEGGREMAAFLQDICHREDPTRPVTCGMDQFDAVLTNGFAAELDVAGFNYKPGRYEEAYRLLPQTLILGSESASTVSSRGVYHFPVVSDSNIMHPDHQSSSYDVEFCSWSNIPDDDFAADTDFPWVIGQFVWTGFDYLGEPSPYDTDAWPNHSSVFGIVDLAYIPKDRYYLYRSMWNTSEPTLHVLPHWNWEGREGETTPVFVYTSYPEAELFVNGVSQGRKSKTDGFGVRTGGDGGKFGEVASRFRLMWTDVVYRPGEIKVVAYDNKGVAVDEKIVRTAGEPYALKLTVDRSEIAADGSDLAFVEVSVVDKNGIPVPVDSRLVNIKVRGAGEFKAVANGDPTCLESFQKPQMHLFSGKLTSIVQATDKPGTIRVTASAKGLRSASVDIRTR